MPRYYAGILWLTSRVLNCGYAKASPQYRLFALTCILCIFVIFIGLHNPKRPIPHPSPELLNTSTSEEPCTTDNAFKNIETIGLANYGWVKLVEPIAPLAVRTYANRLRVFSKIWKSYEQYLIQKRNLEENESIEIIDSTKEPYSEIPMLYELEKNIFPGKLLKSRSLLELKYSFHGKGIVIPCGKTHFHFLLHFIETVRYLGSVLPILIVYAGEDDLPSDYRQYLLNKYNISSINIYDYISETQMKKWSIKPYALLLSPFAEVIMCDADTVWFQRPDILLEDIDYQTHHILMFRDRSLLNNGDDSQKMWLMKNMPLPLSTKVLKTRMYRQITNHEQESGVVVYNKKERLLSIIAGAKLISTKEERKGFYNQFHGDKESFWIGSEMAGESYAEVRPYAGAIGWSLKDVLSGRSLVCGHVAHFDRSGALLWFNGGIVGDKFQNEELVGNFTHYAYGGDCQSWIKGEQDTCTSASMHPFNQTELALLEKLKSLFLPPSKVNEILTDFQKEEKQ